VAGAEEAKEEMQEVVEFSRTRENSYRSEQDTKRGIAVWSSRYRKNTNGKAVAGEAAFHFFPKRFRFCGNVRRGGAARVRDLLNRPKKCPLYSFIDEIDALAASAELVWEAAMMKGTDLEPLGRDGMASVHEGIIVMASTTAPTYWIRLYCGRDVLTAYIN
jgi:ATP-dependent Zn protease